MTNNVMVDSSVLVEFIKNTKTKLLVELLTSTNTKCYINEIVVSEFLYYFLALNSGKAPRSIQNSGKIKDTFEVSNGYLLLNSFSLLPTKDESLFSLVPSLMQRYNLLPNDAIIPATCKMNSIKQLASHDSDFEAACKGEEIILLTEPLA